MQCCYIPFTRATANPVTLVSNADASARLMTLWETYMNRLLFCLSIIVLLFGPGASAQTTRPSTNPATKPSAGMQGAPSKITAVTVYESGALVTRDVSTPDGSGIFELVVGPLPASTNPKTLYSEGGDGVRILTTRYRTWVMQENVQEEMRQIEAQMKDLEKDNNSLQEQAKTNDLNLALLAKMEEFAAGGLKQMSEKGLLNAEAVTKIADYIMVTRAAKGADNVATRAKLAANAERAQFLEREKGKVVGASDKTVREAVIVVDKANAGAATVRLNYIVNAASWRPSYKLRIGRQAKARGTT